MSLEDAEVVVELLKTYKLKLATAESCTGGKLAAAITDVAGASEVFETGVITYANSAKTMLLGVPEEILEKYGAVSSKTAVRMSNGVAVRYGADIGVGITGIAGPGGGTKEKPVGLVYISVYGKHGTYTQRIVFSGSRDSVRSCTVKKCLQMISEYIEKHY